MTHLWVGIYTTTPQVVVTHLAKQAVHIKCNEKATKY